MQVLPKGFRPEPLVLEWADEVRNYGVQYIYEEGEVRIVVRPGSLESVDPAKGWCYEVNGLPGRECESEEEALALAAQAI